MNKLVVPALAVATVVGLVPALTVAPAPAATDSATYRELDQFMNVKTIYVA